MVDFKTVQEGLREIDIAAHNSWHLGKNMVVGWTTHESGIRLCIAPSFLVLSRASESPRLLNGRRLMDADTFAECCKALQVRPIRVSLPFTIRIEGGADGEVDPETVDTVIRRYSIVRTEHRAIMMLEIMNFSIGSPVQQITWLNSLEYSINNAGKKLRDAGLNVELGRSTAGDGFHYVWNRVSGLEADLRTYAALLLILTDNALAQRHAGRGDTVPVLRASFAVGSHYSYHQVEGNKPRSIEYATGEVTITLARLIVKALQGQIVVGNFRRPDETGSATLDSLLFLVRAEPVLQRLAGAVLGEHAIKEIRSIVTSGAINGVAHPVVKYVIEDKHGFRHEAFNLRAKIKREDEEPIELGLRPEQLVNFPAMPTAYVLPAA